MAGEGLKASAEMRCYPDIFSKLKTHDREQANESMA